MGTCEQIIVVMINMGSRKFVDSCSLWDVNELYVILQTFEYSLLCVEKNVKKLSLAISPCCLPPRLFSVWLISYRDTPEIGKNTKSTELVITKPLCDQYPTVQVSFGVIDLTPSPTDMVTLSTLATRDAPGTTLSNKLEKLCLATFTLDGEGCWVSRNYQEVNSLL